MAAKTLDGKASGWQKINERWYYFDPAKSNKALQDGWFQVNDFWYLFNSSGVIHDRDESAS